MKIKSKSTMLFLAYAGLIVALNVVLMVAALVRGPQAAPVTSTWATPWVPDPARFAAGAGDPILLGPGIGGPGMGEPGAALANLMASTLALREAGQLTLSNSQLREMARILQALEATRKEQASLLGQVRSVLDEGQVDLILRAPPLYGAGMEVGTEPESDPLTTMALKGLEPRGASGPPPAHALPRPAGMALPNLDTQVLLQGLASLRVEGLGLTDAQAKSLEPMVRRLGAMKHEIANLHAEMVVILGPEVVARVTRAGPAPAETALIRYCQSGLERRGR